MNNSTWRVPESPDSGDELFWTAFQYAVGELAEGEAARFEERLADDQSAREALSSAVALLEEVRVAESVAAPVYESPTCEVAGSSAVVEPVRRAAAERTVWHSPATWLVGGGFVSCAVACLAMFFSMSNFGTVRNDSESERRLAFAWGESQLADDDMTDDDANTMPNDELLIAASDDSIVDDMGDDEDELPSLNERPTAPDWLIAAVAETHTSDSQE